MSIDKSTIESCIRFAEDIRRVRESRNISLNQIHEETKVDRGLLDEFEENGLANYSMFNRVYLRSLVASYSRIAGIDSDIALRFLDIALAGRYTNGLAAEFLGEAPIMIIEPESEQDADITKEYSLPPAYDARDQTGPPDDEEKGVNEPRTKLVLASSSIRKIAVITTTAIVLFAAAFFVGRYLFADEPVNEPDLAIVSEPTTVENSDPPLLQAQPISIGDTIDILIRPRGGDFSPIRVRVDNDLRRPYWADNGDTISFAFVNKIRFEGRLDRLEIIAFDELYDPGRLSPRTPFTLTRPAIQTFVDELNANR